VKLAEALIERAALQRRVEQLQARIVQNARYQEGEEPAEDAAALLQEASAALEDLRRLILAINLTNAATVAADGQPLTAALATRDVLRKRHAILVAAADAASGSGGYRQLRSELRHIPALPVAGLRAEADDVARRIRHLESTIQQANWEVDLQQR
jgi:hypothetical protein